MMGSGTLARNHGYFEGVGRLRLYHRSWEAADPRGALILAHGLGEHSGRYDAFGEAMAIAGISTFALDLRGHGESDGRRGHVRRFIVFLQDLDRFRREVQGMVDPDCPLFLFGHSLGGLVALRYLEEYDAPLRGAIISSPWLGTAVPVPRWKTTLARSIDRVLPAVPFAAGIRAEDLCRSPEYAAARSNDTLVHDTITPRLFNEVADAMGRTFQRADRIRVPLLFLLAGADRLADCRRARTFADSLRNSEVTSRIYPDHFHEVLNEAGHEAVHAEIRAWVGAHLP